MCLEIYEVDTARFLTTPGLREQAALKMSELKSHLLTGIDMLLMAEICRYANANN